MVGFQAPIEEVFWVKGGARESSGVYHTKWIEMSSKLLADTGSTGATNSLCCFTPVMEKSTYLFPMDRRKGLSSGASISPWKLAERMRELPGAKQAAFLTPYPRPSMLNTRAESRKRRGELRKQWCRVQVEKYKRKGIQGSTQGGAGRRHSRGMGSSAESTMKTDGASGGDCSLGISLPLMEQLGRSGLLASFKSPNSHPHLYAYNSIGIFFFFYFLI